ncbi:hypothetical protein CEP54_012050 [Fusarium duplospermum]|uniref:DUF6536 domain-containing protein n=1 Tax=Fusarium duplospermum TaxID=1325734 RepID=A0A428PAY6_9HYPO|nr:hypothetical protein CEP54_012050 [Fusarium duplospermum]
MKWRHLGTGWRRTALINTVGVFTFTLFGIILLLCTISKSGGLGINYIIFQGTCAKSRSINTWLHLLLNAYSTAILASSNFFMQVLTSPTRSEVDKAHSDNVSLKIGVQSMRNLYRAPRFRWVCWLLFFFTSFPLHLFLNSAIFPTEYMSSDWNLTVASEGFVNGGQYYSPGVAVWPPTGRDNSLVGVKGYGQNLSLSDYFDPESDISKRINFTAKNARNWKRLEVPDCLSQYQYCNGRVDFRDLVMIVKSKDSSLMTSGNSTLGWKQSDIFQLPRPSSKSKVQWYKNFTIDEINSLWFTASCNTQSRAETYRNRFSCVQSCARAFGRQMADLDPQPMNDVEPFQIDDRSLLQMEPKAPASIPSTYSFQFLDLGDTTQYWPDGTSDAVILDVEYCLVQEFSPTCKVCVSNGLLLIVVISVSLKAGLCVMVLRYLPKEDPFVVPGDAIASFIRSPDKFTSGRCLLDKEVEGVLDDRSYPYVGAPMYWQPERRRWSRSIEGMVWLRTYSLLIANFMFLFAMFFLSQSENSLGKQTLTQNATNGVLDVSGATASEFIPAVMKGNLPQLLLSIFYFDYNSFYTRLYAEKEWSSYGTDYRPLRVTEPRGLQRSTYRLQLPYRYSVPLIMASISLHWLVSKSLYVFVFEGGYFEPPTIDDDSSLRTGLSDDAFVGIGWSAPALLVLLVAVTIMTVLPLVLTWPSIKSPMPLTGNSSLVLSAACHVPVPEDFTTSVSDRPIYEHEIGHKSTSLEAVDDYLADPEAAQRFSGSVISEREHLIAPSNTSIQPRGACDSDIKSS